MCSFIRSRKITNLTDICFDNCGDTIVIYCDKILVPLCKVLKKAKCKSITIKSKDFICLKNDFVNTNMNLTLKSDKGIIIGDCKGKSVLFGVNELTMNAPIIDLQCAKLYSRSNMNLKAEKCMLGNKYISTYLICKGHLSMDIEKFYADYTSFCCMSTFVFSGKILTIVSSRFEVFNHMHLNNANIYVRHSLERKTNKTLKIPTLKVFGRLSGKANITNISGEVFYHKDKLAEDDNIDVVSLHLDLGSL